MGEAAEYFKQQTLTQITQKIQSFQARAESLLATIDSQEALFNDTMGDNLKEAYRIIDEENEKDRKAQRSYFAKNLRRSNAEQVIIQAKQEAKLNSLYIEGYRLLNEMGHYFNGEWNYTIVLFGKDNYTFQMSEEEFLSTDNQGIFNYIEATTTGFRLKAQDRTTSNTMADQLMKVNADKMIEQHKWTAEDRSNFLNYNLILNKARNILVNGNINPPTNKEDLKAFAKYNRGQRTEGFISLMETQGFEFLNQVASIVRYASRNHLGEEFISLNDTVVNFYNLLKEQTNTRGFWTGGDTEGHGQIKSTGASIFEFKTIKTQLSKISTLLSNIDLSGIEKNCEGAQGPAGQILNDEVNNILNNLLAGFNATTIAGGVEAAHDKLIADIARALI